ncbi:hypothetical protein WAI453_008219 [Rhynchosporium graminicola]
MERLEFWERCIAHCDEVYYVDPKAEAVEEICQVAEKLVEKLEGEGGMREGVAEVDGDKGDEGGKAIDIQ